MPSSSWSSAATRRAMSSASSFSWRPPGPTAPASWPPCPGSITIVWRDSGPAPRRRRRGGLERLAMEVDDDARRILQAKHLPGGRRTLERHAERGGRREPRRARRSPPARPGPSGCPSSRGGSRRETRSSGRRPRSRPAGARSAHPPRGPPACTWGRSGREARRGPRIGSPGAGGGRGRLRLGPRGLGRARGDRRRRGRRGRDLRRRRRDGRHGDGARRRGDRGLDDWLRAPRRDAARLADVASPAPRVPTSVGSARTSRSPGTRQVPWRTRTGAASDTGARRP